MRPLQQYNSFYRIHSYRRKCGKRSSAWCIMKCVYLANFVAYRAYVVAPFGLPAGVKPRMKLLALAIPYSGNPKVRYDTVFSLGPFNINKSPFRYPFWGCLRAGVKPRIKLLALVIAYSGDPKVRYDTVFSLGPFNINKSPFRCLYVVTPFVYANFTSLSHTSYTQNITPYPTYFVFFFTQLSQIS